MFTGIIEEVGRIKSIYKRQQFYALEIQADKVLKEISLGDSISVEGVCLTVKEKKKDALVFEVMPYTLKNTTLGYLRVNQKVNLERSLKLEDRISGHFVLGHVDCIGWIQKKFYKQKNLCFEISVPTEFMKYCLPKGSVAIDGISLTIAEVKSRTFLVYVIPYTLKNTTLFFKGPSSKVNVEFDILIKTVLKTRQII